MAVVTWGVEPLKGNDAFLLLDGARIARMTFVRACGISKALNGPEGQRLFEEGRREAMDDEGPMTPENVAWFRAQRG